MSKEFKDIEALPPFIRGLIFATGLRQNSYSPAVSVLQHYVGANMTGEVDSYTCGKIKEVLQLKSPRLVLCELVDLMLDGEEDPEHIKNLLQFKFDKEMR